MKPINLKNTIIIFGSGALLFTLIAYAGIKLLSRSIGWSAEVLWFLNSSILLYIPLFLLSLKFAGNLAGTKKLGERLQFLRLGTFSPREMGVTLVSLLAIVFLTWIIITSLRKFLPGYNIQPAFLDLHELKPDEYWTLLGWLPMFCFNIFGEELFWRGLILQGQELHFGKNAYIINSLGWFIFYLPLGWEILIPLLPTLLLLPYLVSKYKNTWIGIIIHGTIYGLGFLAVALGVPL